MKRGTQESNQWRGLSVSGGCIDGINALGMEQMPRIRFGRTMPPMLTETSSATTIGITGGYRIGAGSKEEGIVAGHLLEGDPRTYAHSITRTG